ncbi:MAG TPA: hypothetical protein VFQ80_14560 [Thermomicrobiales bacterium]|nr:hypothetical protein [Thermomicrobiales bacterium]
MEGVRFDAFCRAVASRRSALRSLRALGLAALGVRQNLLPAGAATCLDVERPCSDPTQCCFGICKKRRCVCPLNRQFADCPLAPDCQMQPAACCLDNTQCAQDGTQQCLGADDASKVCCTALCCPKKSICGDGCCTDAENCVRGRCCPTFRSCKGKCCAEGQHCVKGTCTPCDLSCPSGSGGRIRVRWP